ncbi:MAG: FkbM family methyltransferase [Bacteroidota bacterium]
MIEQLKYWYRAYRYKYKVDVAEINFIIQKLGQGDVAVDIGCHKGGYLYWMQRQVGRTGYCYGFEPQPVLFSYLKKIQDLQGWEQVNIEQMGLSSVEGSFTLNIPKTKKGSSPGATINPVDSTQGVFDQVEIKTTTLDTYFLERNIQPKLIKIDVEGHELEVLKGGEQLLTTHRPAILMECEQRHLQQHTVIDVLEQLHSWGYQGQFIEGTTLKPIQEFRLETHQQQGSGRFWEAEGYVNNFVFE